MSYFSDPTANAAVGNIDRVFSRLEKKAKRLCRLYREGKITLDDLERANAQFTGIYRYVLINALKNGADEEQ